MDSSADDACLTRVSDQGRRGSRAATPPRQARCPALQRFGDPSPAARLVMRRPHKEGPGCVG